MFRQTTARAARRKRLSSKIAEPDNRSSRRRRAGRAAQAFDG